MARTESSPIATLSSYALTRNDLRNRITRWLNTDFIQAALEFKETTGRKAGPAHSGTYDETVVMPTSYRPLDVRFLYNKPEFTDRPRLDLQINWGEKNVALFALNGGTGGGPAVWCHGLIPDQHAFRGSYGGWVFPLWDRAGEGIGHRLDPDLVAGLSSIYGYNIPPQEVFDAILALLSASSYTVRFAFDLEDDFPHVPFPSDSTEFRAAAALGARIRSIQTFDGAPAQQHRNARLVGHASGPRLDVPSRGRAFTGEGGSGAVALLADQSLRVVGVSERAWQFSRQWISGALPLAPSPQRNRAGC